MLYLQVTFKRIHIYSFHIYDVAYLKIVACSLELNYKLGYINIVCSLIFQTETSFQPLIEDLIVSKRCPLLGESSGQFSFRQL